jgi:hypothetical protein
MFLCGIFVRVFFLVRALIWAWDHHGFAGFLAGLASILCVIPFPDPFGELNSIALWAVVTTDLLLEGNIGLSVSKGFNRVLGTLAAGLIALALNEIGPLLGYQIYPYFVVRKLLVQVCILVQISAYGTRNQLFALNDELFSWCQWSLCTSAITMLWS